MATINFGKSSNWASGSKVPPDPTGDWVGITWEIAEKLWVSNLPIVAENEAAQEFLWVETSGSMVFGYVKYPDQWILGPDNFAEFWAHHVDWRLYGRAVDLERAMTVVFENESDAEKELRRFRNTWEGGTLPLVRVDADEGQVITVFLPARVKIGRGWSSAVIGRIADMGGNELPYREASARQGWATETVLIQPGNYQFCSTVIGLGAILPNGLSTGGSSPQWRGRITGVNRPEGEKRLRLPGHYLEGEGNTG